MADFLDLDNLLAQLVLALGAALAIGNAFALYMDRQGRKPKGQEDRELRRPRAWFLLAVGLVMTYWGLASVLTR